MLASGFPPRAALEIGFARTGNRIRTVETARTDAEGTATLRLPLPADLDAGQSAAVLVSTPDGSVAAATERFMVRSQPLARADGPAAEEPVVVSGMTTEEGVGCATMRDAQGKRYNLLGAVADYEPGTPVRIIGFPTRSGGCGEGTTLDVTQIERRP